MIDTHVDDGVALYDSLGIVKDEVGCLYCGAKKGKYCHNKQNIAMVGRIHKARLKRWNIKYGWH